MSLEPREKGSRSMYLDHFKLSALPFSLTPNLDFFCQLQGHQGALNTLLFAVRSGEGFIKIVGEVGSGKTTLCRKVLDSLENDFVTAYIPNPDLNPIELRRALLRELGVEPSQIQDKHELLTAINNRLLALHRMGKRIVLLIDEAQALPLESLEGLRLLTNLETEKAKLMQVVLFGQPELDDHLNLDSMRQLKQRISVTYYLPLLTREDMDKYIFHRLAIAGHTVGALFTEKARKKLFKASGGIPRVANILCHKALLVAYGRGEETVTHKIMNDAIKDTEFIDTKDNKVLIYSLLCLGAMVSLIYLLYWFTGII